jgi:hypothetical protein
MSGVLEDSVGQFAIVIPNVVPNRSVKTVCVMLVVVVIVCALTMNPASTNSAEVSKAKSVGQFLQWKFWEEVVVSGSCYMFQSVW